MRRQFDAAGSKVRVHRKKCQARRPRRLFVENLEHRLLLSTDVLSVPSLTLGAGDHLEIEIGGPAAGHSASENDGYDQYHVTGAAALGGTLDVKLVNDYVPPIGQTFEFLTIGDAGSLTGKFEHVRGLFSFPTGDRYFLIAPHADGRGLDLAVAAIPGYELRFQPPADLQDAFGEFLGNYFERTEFEYSGQVSIGSFAQLSGSVTLQKDDALLLVGATDVTAFVGSGFEGPAETGVKVTDARFGLAIDTSAATAKYALRATEGVGGIVGVNGVGLSGDLALEVNRWGAAVDLTVPTPDGDVEVKFDTADVTPLWGSVTLETPVADLSGQFAVEARVVSGDKKEILLGASDAMAFVGNAQGTADTADDVGVRVSGVSALVLIEPDATYAVDGNGTADFAIQVLGVTAMQSSDFIA